MICALPVNMHDLMQEVRAARRRVTDTADQASKRVNELDTALDAYRAAPDPHTALIEVLFNSRSLERDD